MIALVKDFVGVVLRLITAGLLYLLAIEDLGSKPSLKTVFTVSPLLTYIPDIRVRNLIGGVRKFFTWFQTWRSNLWKIKWL